MTDEKGRKVDLEDFFEALMKINQRLASIETSLNTFPAKFDKVEDRLERYHESAISADNKAEKAFLVAQNVEQEIKIIKSSVEIAEDKADKAQISVDNLSKEFKEFKQESKHKKDTSINVWVAVGTAIISALVSIWGFFK